MVGILTLLCVLVSIFAVHFFIALRYKQTFKEYFKGFLKDAFYTMLIIGITITTGALTASFFYYLFNEIIFNCFCVNVN